ncbi:MAG: hypothetical protein RJA22_2036 [Verrucomicrobiota bacterium]|jgi:FADH2 O2-dependent halogenase
MSGVPGHPCDLAIIGSGFGGSLLAQIARRLGLSVVLLESGRHPRFAMGESSTPLANLLLEELAARYDLPRVAPLSKWGAWQRTHPGLACGLKRGFTFYHHRAGEPWRAAPGRPNELLVAASPHDGIADTHWFRADFDQFLAREAEALGAVLAEGVTLRGAEFPEGGGVVLAGEGGGVRWPVRARFVVDASGARGFLARALDLGAAPLPGLPETEALYAHFEGVARWDALHPPDAEPPYPADDAAVHHVFPGGWIWVLRFNNGLTSAGVAATRAVAEELRFAEGAPAWSRLLERLPSVREQFAEARAVRPFVHRRPLAFRCPRAAGRGWALLPSSAGFVDPILSTGFTLTLLGIERLARWLEGGAEALSAAGAAAMPPALAAYSAETLAELDAVAELVGALYANFDDFEVCRALTMLYFAAASYSETMRRLGRAERVGGFLLHRDAVFGPRCRSIVRAARGRPTGAVRAQVLQSVGEAIAPINVAGLGDPARGHWYPARAEDLVAAGPKLGVGRAEMEGLLRLFAG